ncbi:MAG: non-hydrolyzing UDP-N-acetylglucosamine 2-epimerase [Bacteroidota bacterium]
MTKKRIITIIGARPQIIKSSALSRAIRNSFSDKIEEIIVHTGQHYDENMSSVFFEEMEIPKPNYNLNVGSGSHGAQTAKMIEGLEKIFLDEKPNAVVIYGDTNSTIAGAIASAKIHIPIVHIEAGLRSYNKSMPEEINRISADHMSTLLFSPTKTGISNLEKEGFSLYIKSKATIDKPNVYLCGDIMYDNSLYFSSVSSQKSTILQNLGLEGNDFILCTIHRDSNTDIPQNLNAVFKSLVHIQEKSGLKIILPIHPRTKGKMNELLETGLKEKLDSNSNFLIIPPAGFLDIIALEKNARLVITDSGGLQKEAFFFEKPCVILRQQTEWVEIVENGNAILAGSDYDKISSAFDELINKNDFTFPQFYGDGQAANFICSKIVEDIE